MPTNHQPAPAVRPHRGRWLGGVCAGLAIRWNRPVGTIRAAFGLLTLAFGLGAVVYLAAWLIVPAEGDEGRARGPRAIVVLAQAWAALLGLGTLAAAASAATIFGFGWVVVALAGAVLLATLVGWPRVSPAWALLPIGALVVPAVAVAATGVRVDPRTSPTVFKPRTAADLPDTPVRTGLGLLEIDLRRTALPSSGRIPLRIDGGLRRTLVALPHDACVHVEVRQRTLPAVSRVLGTAVGAPLRMNVDGRVVYTPGAQLFGEQYHEASVRAPRGRALRAGPTLVIDFESDGGILVVRDYPDEVEPSAMPDWPGYPVFVEERPHTTGLEPREARRMLRSWRERRAQQQRSQRAVARRLDGPCARPGRRVYTTGSEDRPTRSTGAKDRSKRGAAGAGAGRRDGSSPKDARPKRGTR